MLKFLSFKKNVKTKGSYNLAYPTMCRNFGIPNTIIITTKLCKKVGSTELGTRVLAKALGPSRFGNKQLPVESSVSQKK